MTLAGAITAGNDAIFAILVALNLAATALVVAATRTSARERRRERLVQLPPSARSELATPITIIVPTRDDEHAIVPAVRALLADDYPTLEVVVVDDGSSDGTIDTLRRAFSLVQVERVPRSRLVTRRLQQVYASPLDPRLLVLDKEHGGRSDALNAGLRFARYPLVGSVDARVTLDPDAFVRLTRPFQADAETIACGAGVRLARSGGPLARGRSIWRLRSLLIARTGAARLGGPLLGAGGLGVFRRDAIVEAGGYAADGAADLELTLRLQRSRRDDGYSCAIASLPRPVGTTAGDLGPLARWREAGARQRAVRAVLARNRAMLFRRRYGAIGWFVLPVLALGSALRRPVLTFAAATIAADLALGTADRRLALGELVLAASFAVGLALAALLLDGPPWRPRLRLAVSEQEVGVRRIVAVAPAAAPANPPG